MGEERPFLCFFLLHVSQNTVILAETFARKHLLRIAEQGRATEIFTQNRRKHLFKLVWSTKFLLFLTSVFSWSHWLSLGWRVSPWTHCMRIEMPYSRFCAVCNQGFNLCHGLRYMFFSLDYFITSQLQVEEQGHFFKRKSLILTLCQYCLYSVISSSLIKISVYS